MPETVEVCRSIRDAWTSKEPGKKYVYEVKINAIGSLFQNDCDHSGLSMDAQQQFRQSRQKICHTDEKSCDAIAEELGTYHSDLEACVEEEFPIYACEKPGTKS